jgi:hypothetical protein
MATPTYPLDWLLTAGGEQIVTAGGDRLQSVTDPSQAHDRARAVLLELEVDTCLNSFGVAPCTATGAPCYNTLATCKDRPNYRRGTRLWRFALRGQAAPPGEAWRPYIEQVSIAPTEIKPAAGLALRSQTTVTLVDESDSDVEGDPYRATRGTPAAGTFWGRWVARNPNAINRPVRLRRGWWGQPFSYAWFADETYILDQVRGPDKQGRVQLVLSDPLRLADRAQVPAPTDGKLAEALPLRIWSGALVTADATLALLPAGAVPDRAAYVGHEIHLTTNLGAGQRRVIADYDPVSRVIAVAAAWDVIPNGTTLFEIVPLSAALQTGQGVQYSGATHVRIGKEVIALSGVVGDRLQWASGTSRGAFGSTPDEHDADSAVQRCAVWQDAPPSALMSGMLQLAGVSPESINVVRLDEIEATWLREAAHITACLTAPGKVTDHIKELSADLGLMLWWDPVAALVQSQINLPNRPGDVPLITDDLIVENSLAIERLDAERLTQVAQFYGPADPTQDAREPRGYLRGEVRVDLDAQSANEYRDSRPEVRYSRWLSAPNEVYVRAAVTRRLNALRDAPVRLSFAVDPRNVPVLGELVDIRSRDMQGADGEPVTVRTRVVKLNERDGQVEVTALSTPFGNRRWGFIAPGGQPDYAGASATQKQYAYISAAGGTNFADGGAAYRII